MPTETQTLNSAQDLPFTVLLGLPDYMADNYGQDTRQYHVNAPTPEDAQEMACILASEADGKERGAEDEFEPEDYHVSAVYEGHLTNLANRD